MNYIRNIVLIMAVAVCGCRGWHDARLEELDSALWRNPDSVYEVIGGIDTIPLNERERAFLNLLRAEAADKSNHTDTTSATISVLEDYYLDGDRESDLHPRVNYILGRIHIERGEKPKALEYYRRALRNSKSNSDARLMMTIYGQLAYLSSRSKLFRHALEYSKQLQHYSKIAGNKNNIVTSKLWIAKEYQYLNDNDSAKIILEEARPLVDEYGDPKITTLFNTQLAAFYGECGDYERADSVIKSTGIAVDGSSRSSVGSIINDIDLHFGRTEELERRSLDLLAHCDDIYARKTAARNLARICIDRGDARRGLDYAERFHLLADSISEMEAAAAVAELDEFYSQSELAESNLEMEKNIASLTKERFVYGGVGVAALAACWLLFFLRAQKRKEDYKRKEDALLKGQGKYLMELNEINEKLLKTGAELTKANKEIDDRNSLLKRSREEMGKLRERVEEAESRIRALTAEKEEKTRLLHAINAGINEKDFVREFYSANKKGGNEAAMLKLVQFVGELDPEFQKEVGRLGLSSRDFNDAMMIRLNIDRNKTARIFNITGAGISNRRKRLYEKFEAEGHDMGGTKNWQEFIMSFSTLSLQGNSLK